MALKIFLSSVFHELVDERNAVSEEISKLRDLFIGMEFFGSDPSKPLDYCIREVERSDLYVGLFGFEYGSIADRQHKSFTELEYRAAYEKGIPCLIYFKANDFGGKSLHETDERLISLKKELKQAHIVYTFRSIQDLKIQFLVDFIKLLRTALYHREGALDKRNIPADALHSLTRAIIADQIRTVGQDKYIPSIYINREAEKAIIDFVEFEAVFLQQATEILSLLRRISINFDLSKRTIPLVEQIEFSLRSPDHSVLRLIDDLKTAFFTKEIEGFIAFINKIILEPSDHTYTSLVREITGKLRSVAFVDNFLLKDFTERLLAERQKALTKNALVTDKSYWELFTIFPSVETIGEKGETNIRFVTDLLAELIGFFELHFKRCKVIVDKAGTGKTNICCHLAEKLIEQYPVILLSGQMEISNEYDIEFHVQRLLDSAVSGIFSDWMNRINADLTNKNKWLFIILDGINENANVHLMIRLFKNLLPKLSDKRIKLIVTCRDLSWDLFQNTFNPYLFRTVIHLNEFTVAEWKQALRVYLNKYNIQCNLDKNAKEALKNPLLLRFFCEAYKDTTLGAVSNLRLLSVFDLYTERINQNITQQLGLLKSAVLLFLLNIAHNIWHKQSVYINLSDLGLAPDEIGENNSLYNRILSENVILEESRHTHSVRKSIRFIYDEFMEYMIARSWIDEICEANDAEAATERILQTVVASLESFTPGFGAILFFDQMLNQDGKIVNRAIIIMAKLGKTLQQTQLIYALEKMNLQTASDELINAIESFECYVRDEFRERIAFILLKVLDKHPEHPFAKKYIHKVLEIDSNSSGKLEEKDIPPSSMPILPPARFHYTEETRVNAISILVGLKNNLNYHAIEEGIRKLGRTDLHSALQAFQYLDLSSDEIVYRSIGEFIRIKRPEYRVFCAWLLRERYGDMPSNFMIGLLLDNDMRVHQYAAGIFKTRLIESQLAIRIMTLIQKGHLHNWHLRTLIKLLGNRKSMVIEQGNEVMLQIPAVLITLLDHSNSSVRLDSYRSLLQYSELIDMDLIRDKMLSDDDAYIREDINRLISDLDSK